MKTKITIAAIILFNFCMTIAGVSAVPKKSAIRAHFNYTVFNTVEDKPYIETYLSIDGSSVQFKEKLPHQYSAIIEATFVFYKDTTIITYSKNNIESPIVGDSSQFNIFFFNQQRLYVPQGTYRLEVTLVDKNLASPSNKTKESIDVDINFPDEKVCFSGLEFVDRYHKTEKPIDVSRGGYDLYPYFGNFFPDNKNDLNFYYEIYNAEKLEGKDKSLIIKDYVQVFETAKTVEQLVNYRKVKSASLIPHFGIFDLSKLPSGNYLLVSEVLNKENKVLAGNQAFFQKSNPNLTIDEHLLANIDLESSFIKGIPNDTLKKFIRYLYPIATGIEKIFIYDQLETADYPLRQRFFINFWSDRNAMRPDLAWQTYYASVQMANREFGTPFKAGYLTDRGRVYLQYGPPNTIDDRKFDTAGDDYWGTVPYQIWHYYKLDSRQANKRFVFYNPDLSTQEYPLLHSDALGEVNDPSWYTRLSRQPTINESAPQQQYYRILEDFRNPR